MIASLNESMFVLSNKGTVKSEPTVDCTITLKLRTNLPIDSFAILEAIELLRLSYANEQKILQVSSCLVERKD